ncbi:MAG: flippase activity-associated protein Agl23, partial [Planctomycetota bacterium]
MTPSRALTPGSEGRNRRWVAVWLALLLLNALSHFVGVGDRAMSHDESIHAYYAWELAENGSYRHDPTYHGPLLYNLNALVFILVGDSDATARLVPVLAGLLLIALVYGTRRYLGEMGAFCAAVLVSASPALLFYGRYLRNDIYMAVWTLLWALAAWRYLETRRTIWLCGVALAMALSFATKETSFIFGAVIGSFFLLLTLVRVKWGGESWRDSASGDLVLLMLGLVLPFAAPLLYLLLGWDPVDFGSGLAWRHFLMVVPSLAATALALVGLALWLRRAQRTKKDAPQSTQVASPSWATWVGLFTGFWLFETLLFTTWLTNPRRGLLSGFIGSLGYWLGQHEVARGDQPWFYYLLIAGLYEFLPLLLSVVAGIVLIRRRGLLTDLAGTVISGSRTDNGEQLADSPRAPLGPVPWFLAWWVVMSWLAFSLAGEKMPWLVVHLTLPMILLSGWWLDRALESVEWRQWSWERLLLPVAAPLLLLVSMGRLLRAPFRGREVQQIADTTRFLLAIGIVLAVVVLLVRWLRKNHRGRVAAARWLVLALGGVAALGLLTLRTSLLLNYRNHESAVELMVYAHATPDIKIALAEIDELDRHAGPEGGVRIAYDAETSWPFVWYLRDRPGRLFFGSAPTPELLEVPVIISGPASQDSLWPFTGKGYAQRQYRLLWWPPYRFTNFGAGDLRRVLADDALRRQVWQYLAHRWVAVSFRDEWPQRRDFYVHFKRDLVLQAWGLDAGEPALGDTGAATNAVEELRVDPLAVHAGPYDGEPLRVPAQIAVGEDGDRLVADSGNDRIVVLSRDGSLERILGTACGARSGRPCPDPDGAGPLPLESEKLEEPWGVATLPDGRIVVADTWNGRLLTFDREGRPLASWGRPEIGGSPPVAANRLYGPRSVVYREETGELLLGDTGHHRIVALTGDDSEAVIGGPGVTEGHFQEPVGVAIDG